ncbi:MAG: hypothetical protein J6U54_14675 [Clostridiales bacterium]|nr:hypothetical protein [Clostridiales bacterium]
MRTKKMIAVIVMLVMAVVMIFAGCEKLDPEATISIDGKEFQLNCKVSDLTDAGLILASFGDASAAISEDQYPTIKGREMSRELYYILTADKVSTNVYFQAYNLDTTDASLSDCRIYCFNLDYDTYASNKGAKNKVEVKLNGVDFYFTDCNETVNALQEKKFKFDSKEVADFTKDDMYGKSIISADGLHGMSLSIKHDYDYEDGKVRVNGFELTKKLDYEYK